MPEINSCVIWDLLLNCFYVQCFVFRLKPLMPQERKIIHIDMDCYYAQVEMRDNPELRDKPIAVGGEGQRSVLCTCNYAARQFGVRSAMPATQAKKLCPGLLILPGRMEVYKTISSQIRTIFSQYTDLIEPLSLDEAYLDVSESRLFNGSATLIAEDIRRQIFEVTGLTASAGVSVNKFIAKVASDVNKPNGICVVPPDKILEFVHSLPVKAVPGVGKVMQQKLKEIGIENCIDLLPFSLQQLENQFGKMGGSLYRRVRGIDDREVSNHREAKTVSVERTFSHDFDSKELTEDILIPLIERLATRLEKAKKPVSKIQVKLKFADFVLRSKETQYHQLDLSLYQQMLKELAQQRPNCKIRLIGIGVGLGAGALQQMALFDCAV